VVELNESKPVGVLAPTPPVSDTVAVHVVVAVTATEEGEQVRLVAVGRSEISALASVASWDPLKSFTVTFAV
jgi:hypothetical protein